MVLKPAGLGRWRNFIFVLVFSVSTFGPEFSGEVLDFRKILDPVRLKISLT